MSLRYWAFEKRATRLYADFTISFHKIMKIDNHIDFWGPEFVQTDQLFRKRPWFLINFFPGYNGQILAEFLEGWLALIRGQEESKTQRLPWYLTLFGAKPYFESLGFGRSLLILWSTSFSSFPFSMKRRGGILRRRIPVVGLFLIAFLTFEQHKSVVGIFDCLDAVDVFALGDRRF